MPRFVVLPYKMTSKSAKLLANALECLRVHPDGNYKPQPGDIIINWGSGYNPTWLAAARRVGAIFLNPPNKVLDVIDKKVFLNAAFEAGVNVVPFTQWPEKAARWLRECDLIARQDVEGRDGSGIVFLAKGSRLIDAPLYSKYIPQTKEFRVYVFKGRIIEIREKKRKAEFVEQADMRIRTEANHWVFVQADINSVSEEGKRECLKSLECVGLDFGGVDLIYNDQEKKYYVLEVNSAPGIFGRTVTRFAMAINQYVDQL